MTVGRSYIENLRFQANLSVLLCDLRDMLAGLKDNVAATTGKGPLFPCLFLPGFFASGLHEAGYLWVEARGTTRASRMMLFGRRGVLAWIKDRAILAARAPMAALC